MPRVSRNFSSSSRRVGQFVGEDVGPWPPTQIIVMGFERRRPKRGDGATIEKKSRGKRRGEGGEGGRRRRDRGVEGLCYQKVPADRHRRQPREH